MNHRLIAACLLALCVIFAGAGLISAQSKNEAKKEDVKKDEKPAKEEPEPLEKAEFDALMEEVKTSWNKLKINARKKMGDKAAECADELAAAAPKILLYDGLVLTGDKKGEKARDQKDYKDWVAELEKQAKEYSKHAKKSDWDKAKAAQDKINEVCGACHDVYEPE
jgi:cytochrome c556